MESVRSLFRCVEEFGTETIGRTLYTNETSARSREITWNIGRTTISNSENRLLASIGAIITGVFTTFTLGQVGASLLIQSDQSFSHPTCSQRLSLVAHFTIIPLMDGGLKVLYNFAAAVGNVAKSALCLLVGILGCEYGYCKKSFVFIGYVASNIIEIWRNAIRAIPIMGHGLAKLVSQVSTIPIIGNLVEEISQERLIFTAMAYRENVNVVGTPQRDELEKYKHHEFSCLGEVKRRGSLVGTEQPPIPIGPSSTKRVESF